MVAESWSSAVGGGSGRARPRARATTPRRRRRPAASRSAPRRVRRSGAPGPAPTKEITRVGVRRHDDGREVAGGTVAPRPRPERSALRAGRAARPRTAPSRRPAPRSRSTTALDVTTALVDDDGAGVVVEGNGAGHRRRPGRRHRWPAGPGTTADRRPAPCPSEPPAPGRPSRPARSPSGFPAAARRRAPPTRRTSSTGWGRRG